ncbi:putative ABC transporter, periplasmic binding protein [Desulfosarcina variabilis str. Montpellier]|uniref:ABC transporter substrate-binding protein n=1 Tax=Desulfosarcina variabilis TaxID=2300 RepID=UPI003AFB2088
MMKNCFLISVAIGLFLFPITAYSQSRILYVDSYHKGYGWSDGILEGIQSVLKDANVKMTTFHMDTKRNADEGFKKKAALTAKAMIESFNPDVVIASDDNASKYIIQPYYKDARLPFVFCGVNNSGDAYGYPYKNVTGMIEVSPMPKLIYSLKHFARTEKVALLIGNSLTDHKDADSYNNIIELPFDRIHVDDFKQWKNEYIRIQNNYDVLLVGNNGSVNGWNDDEALMLVMSKTKIPSGCDLDFMTPYTFLGYTRSAQEQGRWAAEAALKIINGTPASDIPLSQNVEGDLTINLKVAQAASIKVPRSFMRKAVTIIK